MDLQSPLDPVDPNIPSRKPNGKSQAFHQFTSQESPAVDSERYEAPFSDTTPSAVGSFLHVTRPSLTGVPSFQRPRKRVFWRNKACLIALPLEDGSGRNTSKASYLSQDDFEKRLKDWKDQGFNTSGFTLATQTSNPDSTRLEGQSRAMHPDPEDLKDERARGTYRVKIPVQRHWVCMLSYESNLGPFIYKSYENRSSLSLYLPFSFGVMLKEMLTSTLSFRKLMSII